VTTKILQLDLRGLLLKEQRALWTSKVLVTSSLHTANPHVNYLINNT
jgi:hypothetical protein